MKLKAHLFSLTDEGNELLASMIPEGEREIVSSRWSVPLHDSVLEELIAAGESTGGFWVSAEALLSPKEQRATTHFEVVCRKVISATDEDYETNESANQLAPLVDKGGFEPVRLMRDLSLTRIALKPNMVGAIGGWESEYVAGSDVVSAFNPEAFSGLSFLPVNNPRTREPHEGFHQLYTDDVLEPTVIDCSVQRIQSDFPEEDGMLRHLGNLSYAQKSLPAEASFLRTAEPWDGCWGSPSWVVSRRVVDVFAEQKFRGWAFRPVLLCESDMYSSYEEQWTYLNELISQYSLSEFDGGRW